MSKDLREMSVGNADTWWKSAPVRTDKQKILVKP